MTDPEKREIYDKWGEQGIKEKKGSCCNSAPMDVFEMFFSGGCRQVGR